jgi:hypothetical protein
MRAARASDAASAAASSARRVDAGLLVALLLTLFAIWPLLAHRGLPNTADGAVHLMRQAELNQAWKDGILYPRWAPDLAYGYGMPLFHYAPPLLYQVTQGLHMAGLPLDEAMKSTLIMMVLLYSTGSYLFVRDVFSPRAGVLAAATYLYAPYRLRELYIQGNYGQFCGLAFYPLILWAFYRSATDRSPRYLPLAGLALAGLLLSHNISFMLFVPLWMGYLAYLLLFGAPEMLGRRTVVKRFVLAGVLGLGLAAFFWLPAFAERDAIRLAGITTGFFDFRRNFIGLDELLALPRPLDQAAVNPYFPLSLGASQLAWAGLALVSCLVCLSIGLGHFLVRGTVPDRKPLECPADRHLSGHVLYFGAALLVYGFLMLPESQPLWEAAPLLELAEFPWRMLGPAGLCAAVLAGGWVHLWERWFASAALSQRAGRVVLVIGLALTLAAHLFYFFPTQFIAWGTPTPDDVMAYERRSRAIGTTSTGEFLPRWAERHPSPDVLAPPQASDELAPRVEPLSLPEGARTRTLQVTAHQILLYVNSPRDFTATFRLLYWPGWQVWIRQLPDGAWQPVTEVEVTRPDGLMRAPLPAGEIEVLLRLEESPLRRFSAWVSLLAAIACAGIVLWTRLHPTTKSQRAVATSPDAHPRPTLRTYPRREALILASGLLAAVLAIRPLESWLRVQSPPGSVVGVEHPRRATFADQVHLLGYDLPSCSQWWTPIRCTMPADEALPEILAQPGETLRVVLYWQALRPLERDYSVFLHLNGLDQRTYAGDDEVHPDDIPTSSWPPTMYVRNPMRLVLPADAPPVRYTLQTGLYLRANGKRLHAAECACSEFPLAYVWLLPAAPLTEQDIPNRLGYRLGNTIQLLGYQLERSPDRLTLYWRTDQRQVTRYTVFIHVYDAHDHMIAQADSPPFGGLYPTDAWLPGQIIADLHTLALPAQAHILRVGLYDLSSMQRLSATGPDGQPAAEDAIVIPIANAEL